MASIQNDQELKAALDSLTIGDQRALGALFIESVQHLYDNPRLAKMIEVAKGSQQNSFELEESYKAARSLSTQTFTACGDDADWPAQAAHFVASAAKACLIPESQLGSKGNLAWKTAVQARMANNCIMIDSDSGEVNNEAQKQYVLAEKFINSL